MGFKAVLYAPDGDYVTDFKRDTIEEVEQELCDMGSRWYFYPMPMIIDENNIIVKSCSMIIESEFDEYIGKTVKDVQAFIRANPEIMTYYFS